MKKRIIMIILIVAICFTYFPISVLAQGVLPSGVPHSEIEGQIESYIEKHKDTTAALSTAIFRGEDTISKTIYGFSNIENQILADEETVYEWGSAGKLLVWVSVMQQFLTPIGVYH